MSPGPARDRLEAVLNHEAHLLPVQGPIGVFIHHNTLHAFQHLPFEQAVRDAARTFGAEPFMEERAFREALARGRILPEDLDAVLAREPDVELWSGGLTRTTLRRAMLWPGVGDFRPETVEWAIAESPLGSDPRLDFCLRHMPEPAPATAVRPVRPRDGVLAAAHADIDEVVEPHLIKLCAAFLDQGLANWPMPYREEGFWRATLRLLAQPATLTGGGLRRLDEFARMARPWDAPDAVLHWLGLLGVDEDDWPGLIQAELLALPGWAGLMHTLEHDPALAPHHRAPASLMDFLAVRLLLTVAATASVTGDLTSWRLTRPPAAPHPRAQLARAATLADAIGLAGLPSPALAALPGDDRRRLFAAIEEFGAWERRRVLQLAYERRHERQVLLPLAEHRRSSVPATPARAAAQVIFCIDEREEAIRRHLEETDPGIETLGAAGFFGAAVNFAGIDDAHGVPLCPVVVKPRHAVEERPAKGEGEVYARRRALRRVGGQLVRHWFVSSRTLLRGWLGTAGLGLLSIFPLAARVLSPRLHGEMAKRLYAAFLPEPITELAFMRDGAQGQVAEGGLLRGFTVEENTDRVTAVLGAAGLRQGLARLVTVLGHGSTSLNNPHESAHDCGACGGRRGGPNARLFAAMANHPDVRTQLRERGLEIPADTWFVGGYHDTCSDDIDLFDLNLAPPAHAADLLRVRAALDRARALSAHERARRFEAASYSLDAAGGLRHAQVRAEHLAEPRPEYGHCTNAVCIVGRRSTTRGLFLDRRAFLVSYDASQDPENQSLAAQLGAVVPVCGGISLEYYFSFVDNEAYGCGTKLPHNVTGLVGVMNGYESDLRTGLPWQMVEIHEPVRILFVVESSPERVLDTMRKNPLVWEFLVNRWIRLAVLDPAGGPPLAYRDGAWEPVEGGDVPLPVAPSSMSWYAGRREHLPIARIQGAAA